MNGTLREIHKQRRGVPWGYLILAVRNRRTSVVDMSLISLHITAKLKSLMNVKLLLRLKAAKRQGYQEEKKCFLLELPTELLLSIVSYLSVADEACLALTCKSLLSISGAILDSETLHFSQDFAPLFHHYKNIHNFSSTRWQFLNVLEDSKWRVCSHCLKLHPKSAFPPRELKRKSEVRVCDLGEWAGVIDLCPCKKLTFRDKTELIRHLSVRQSSLNVLTGQFGLPTSERYCWHSCQAKYGSSELKIKIYPELDEKRLNIRTEYELYLEAGQLAKEAHTTARFGCAHRSLDLWLAGICQSSACHVQDSICTACKRLSTCSTCNTMLKCPQRRPYYSENENRDVYSFSTKRCLGSQSTDPDRDWAVQRSHPAESSFNADNCTELCPWVIREHPLISWPPALERDIIDSAIDDASLSALYSSIRMM